jgi:hypothetical protein
MVLKVVSHHQMLLIGIPEPQQPPVYVELLDGTVLPLTVSRTSRIGGLALHVPASPLPVTISVRVPLDKLSESVQAEYIAKIDALRDARYQKIVSSSVTDKVTEGVRGTVHGALGKYARFVDASLDRTREAAARALADTPLHYDSAKLDVVNLGSYAGSESDGQEVKILEANTTLWVRFSAFGSYSDKSLTQAAGVITGFRESQLD